MRRRGAAETPHALAEAAGLRFPVLVKPNAGGFGAGIARLDSPDELAASAAAVDAALGEDGVALLEEFMEPDPSCCVKSGFECDPSDTCPCCWELANPGSTEDACQLFDIGAGELVERCK